MVILNILQTDRLIIDGLAIDAGAFFVVGRLDLWRKTFWFR